MKTSFSLHSSRHAPPGRRHTQRVILYPCPAQLHSNASSTQPTQHDSQRGKAATACALHDLPGGPLPAATAGGPTFIPSSPGGAGRFSWQISGPCGYRSAEQGQILQNFTHFQNLRPGTPPGQISAARALYTAGGRSIRRGGFVFVWVIVTAVQNFKRFFG